MAKFVFKDAVVMFDGRNISGELSSVSLEYNAETPERTVMGDGTKTRLPGVLDIVASHNGWWDAVSAADSLDADLFAKIGAASGLMSFSPDGGQIGEIGFSFPVQSASYVPGATHGEVFAFAVTVNSDGPLVRGSVMENSAFASGANNGTSRQLGASAATDTITSVIHAVAIAGTSPTLDVIVESDDATGFPSPITRLTHPQLTALGSNRQTLVGAVTDDWWRLKLTVGGTSTPSFTVFGVIAIQKTLLP